MAHLQELGHGAGSTSMVDQHLAYIKTKMANDVKVEKDLLKLYDEKVQDWDLEKVADIIKMVNAAQGRAADKQLYQGNHVCRLKNTKKRTKSDQNGTKTGSVKEYQEKDKIISKPDKNGKRGEAGKSQKHLQ
nr:hypothetical protein [Tanacetum cinerariifolium]